MSLVYSLNSVRGGLKLLKEFKSEKLKNIKRNTNTQHKFNEEKEH